MIRTLLVAGLCLLPALAGAEMWKWRSADGLLHYSNDPARVPAGARELTARIGYIGTPGLPPVDEQAIGADLQRYREMRSRRTQRPAPTTLMGPQDVGPWPIRQVMLLGTEGPLVPFSDGTVLPSWMTTDQWRYLQGVEGWLDRAEQQLERRTHGAGS
jgi:hypothetical protein